MFGVDFNELLVIFIIGLLVLGPQRLPKVAAEIGKWVGRARRTANELRRQLEREIELNDIQPPPSAPPTQNPAETQNPFHHMPPEAGASPNDTSASQLPAPPAAHAAPPPGTNLPVPAHEASAAESATVAPPPAPAPEPAKTPEPTDRPPHS